MHALGADAIVRVGGQCPSMILAAAAAVIDLVREHQTGVPYVG